MAERNRCTRCGHGTEVMDRPMRRLRFTRYWGYAFLTGRDRPLRLCPSCGSIFRHDGELIAAGATLTVHEEKLIRHRNDMKWMRAGFGSVIVGSGLGVAWTLLGPLSYDMIVTAGVAAVGALALPPFEYFNRKVRIARRELRALKSARKEGKVFE